MGVSLGALPPMGVSLGASPPMEELVEILYIGKYEIYKNSRNVKRITDPKVGWVTPWNFHYFKVVKG